MLRAFANVSGLLWTVFGLYLILKVYRKQCDEHSGKGQTEPSVTHSFYIPLVFPCFF